MIEQHSFPDLQELTERRGSFKKSFLTIRDFFFFFFKQEGEGMGGEDMFEQMETEREHGEVEEHQKIKMTLSGSSKRKKIEKQRTLSS